MRIKTKLSYLTKKYDNSTHDVIYVKTDCTQKIGSFAYGLEPDFIRPNIRDTQRLWQ